MGPIPMYFDRELVLQVLEAELPPVSNCFTDPQESVEEVSQRDSKVLERLSVSHTQVADKIESVLKRGHRLLSDFVGKAGRLPSADQAVIIDGIVKVSFKSAGWPYRCPLCRDRIPPDGAIRMGSDATITNLKTEKSFKCHDLTPHIIGHRFFGATTSSYRIDPALACEVLDIHEGQDYKIEMETTKRWCTAGRSPLPTGQNIAKYRKRAIKTCAITSSIDAYVLPDEKLHLFVRKSQKIPKDIKLYDIEGGKLHLGVEQTRGHATYVLSEDATPVLGPKDSIT